MQVKRKETTTYRLNPDDRQKLKEVARQRGKAPSVIVRELVERYLDSEAVKAA